MLHSPCFMHFFVGFFGYQQLLQGEGVATGQATPIGNTAAELATL